MGGTNRLWGLIFLIGLLILLASNTSLVSGKSPVTADYPSVVAPNEFFEITLHIDPSIAKYANYIVFDDVISDLKLAPTSELPKSKINYCRDLIIPYDGSSTISIPVYYKFSSAEALKKHLERTSISLERIESYKDINSLLKDTHYNTYNPLKDNTLNYSFIYPFECSTNGVFEWSGIPLVRLRIDQEVIPRKISLDLPKGAVVKDDLNFLGDSYFTVGKMLSYSDPGGLQSGTPPHYDFQFSSRNFDYNYNSGSYEFPESYDSFKSFFNKEVFGGNPEKKVFDVPKNILNLFNADVGFYTYQITTYHDSQSEDPDETYYYLDFRLHIYPKNTLGYYSVMLVHEDITDSFSEQGVVEDALKLISSSQLSFSSDDVLKKNSLYAVNDKALKILSGKELEVLSEEPVVEQKDISSKEFSIKFSGPDSETIWNRGRFNVEDDDSFNVLLKIKGEAKDSEGKRIKKVSDSDLFSGVKLVSEIQGLNESQIGLFSSLSKDDSRNIYSDLETVEVRGKGPRLYKGFYRPTELIKFHLEWNGKVVSNYLTFKVDVKDASPSIKLKKSSIKVQDGDKRGVSFVIKDADKSKLTCSLMVPTDFAIKNNIPFPVLVYGGKKSSFIKFDCKDSQKISFLFYAPNFGNFDLGSELNALSMWKMQEDTMTSLATDLIGFGVSKRLDSLKQSESLQRVMGEFTNDKDMLSNAKQLKGAIDTLGTANEIATHSQNAIKITQIVKNKDSLNSDIAEASKSKKKGWLEWGADWGIFGINVAQSTVGAVAMLPGKIPVLGPLGKKLGGAFSLTFNLMTNVWKGNFQYLSKAEKLDRAQEMIFPYPVIITVQDEDGFVTKEIQNMMVVYNWLE